MEGLKNVLSYLLDSLFLLRFRENLEETGHNVCEKEDDIVEAGALVGYLGLQFDDQPGFLLEFLLHSN